MLYLETPRLILRDYVEADFAAYYRLKSDARVMYYLQDIQLFDERSAWDDFERVLDDRQNPDRTFYFLHMETKGNHAQVGSIGYTVTARAPEGKLVHAGYFTYPRFWGNGYVTEAFKRVLQFAFTENGVYRVSTGCLAENRGSERVMQKCGLVKERELPGHEWHDGKLKTRLEYRLLKSEYLAQSH